MRKTKLKRMDRRRNLKRACFTTTAALLAAAAIGAANAHENKGTSGDTPVVWTSNGAPTEASITGGPWTLEQSGAAVGLKSAGYCDTATGTVQIGNPGTERMQPYYFPVTFGQGNHLQGYFDWRPKDTDEAVVAAYSDDAGQTWNFQGKALELRTLCPSNKNKLLDGTKNGILIGKAYYNADNTDDDGQGHSYVIAINGHTYLYTLNRSNNHIDADPLVIHDLSPTAANPLNGAPAKDDGPTDGNNPGDALNSSPEPALATNGLLNPDGILAAIPGTSPLKVIYEEKQLNGDASFSATQQCATYWSAYYAANGGLSPNDDVTTLHLVETTDGISFTEIGPLQGLNDPTTVSAEGTRWVATAGTVMKLHDGRYGLFFSGGNCIDADSDSFHYIGYAESSDLLHWTVINGLNNPVASIAPVTLTVDANNLPASSGSPVTIPSQAPVVGNNQGWFAGRVYGPSATLRDRDHDDVTMVFAGYHTQKPKNGLGDYRTISRVSLHASKHLDFVGVSTGGGDLVNDGR